MRKRKTFFTKDDVSLWKRVADSTTPLSTKRGQSLREEMRELMHQALIGTPNQPTVSPQPKTPAYRVPTSQYHSPQNLQKLKTHPIEDNIAKKLAKGRLPIDIRIDLHGMTQDRARLALLDFLQMAQRADYRIVLVITGKGNEGKGVLRQNVPNWLHLKEFSALINGFRDSHISHGGEGALYVRIRKLQRGSKLP